jgi:hypothetical protein
MLAEISERLPLVWWLRCCHDWSLVVPVVSSSSASHRHSPSIAVVTQEGAKLHHKYVVMAYLSCWSFMFCVQSSLACCLLFSRGHASHHAHAHAVAAACKLVLFLLIDQTMLTYSFHPFPCTRSRTEPANIIWSVVHHHSNVDHHARQHKILQMLALCLVHACMHVLP